MFSIAADFVPGMRVRTSPATSLWVAGYREATVVTVGARVGIRLSDGTVTSLPARFLEPDGAW